MEELNWGKAKKHFDEVKKEYQDLKNKPHVNPYFALMIVFDPLLERYDSGERTKELFDKMMAVE